MTSTLNIQLPDALRRFVDMRASDNDIYATPSEYIRDLIRKDLHQQQESQDIDLAETLFESLNAPTEPMPKNFFDKYEKAFAPKSKRSSKK